jgi:hypothetical protein
VNSLLPVPALDSLSADDLDKLYTEVAALEADLRARLLTRRPAPEQRPDEVVRIKEACTRMRWSYSWAVKHWKALGGFKDADGGLKIRADVLARRTLTG